MTQGAAVDHPRLGQSGSPEHLAQAPKPCRLFIDSLSASAQFCGEGHLTLRTHVLPSNFRRDLRMRGRRLAHPSRRRPELMTAGAFIPSI